MTSEVATPAWTRWGQLLLGIVCLVMIANLQYGWTLFIEPIDQKYHWGRAAIQVAFTIYIVTETWLAPIGGYLIDRFGPRVMVCGGGALVAAAWVLNSVANSLWLFYVAAIVAGLGAGPIFGAAVGNALKWFPDRRGLATGLSAAGFGAGSALTVLPLANAIQTSGYRVSVVRARPGHRRHGRGVDVAHPTTNRGRQFGGFARAAERSRHRAYRGAEVAAILVAVRDVRHGRDRRSDGDGSARSGRPRLCDRQRPGLDARLDHAGNGFALSIGLVLNGLSRPFFGWVSDHIGRENTMFMAFLLEGTAIYALFWFADNPTMFVLLSGLVYFCWGEIFALFPATCTDLYGRKFATTNYSMLYTAKGTAALLVPLGNVLATATGSWQAVFVVAAALSIVAALLALVALKPMRKRAK